MADKDADGTVLFGYRDIAEIVGISEGTLRNYCRRGYMPQPDVMLADRPRWREATITEWKRERLVGANTNRNAR
jgi:predicted DNA-binding transcriptional regulator AlpA